MVAPVLKGLFAWRLLIGLAQGVLLYFLFEAAHLKHPFAQHALLFVPSLLLAFLIPPAAAIGLNYLRVRRLLLWCVVLAVVVACVGHHDAWRDVQPLWATSGAGRASQVNFPTFHAAFFSAAMVFVGYTLILAGEAAKAWFAPYASYFVLAWKLALQIALSLIFVGVFYLVLWAGAELFMLLKLTFFRDLLEKSWFYMPVCAMAFSVGLHITDVREDFIRGMRTLLLTLMSWLLPLLVLIVAGFLVSSLFAGLEPLWATRSTASVLLGVVALAIVLINAVFKNGFEGEAVPRVLRISARAGSLMLPVLVLVTAYALALRIGQYGVTGSRVQASACTLVAGCYAVGYAWAAFDRKSWLQRIAPTNVITAWVSLAVVFALFTPLADPARLSVDSQVSRLLSGRVTPDKFDFKFLRFRSAIYGRQALARLQSTDKGSNAAAIRQMSAQALQATSPYEANAPVPTTAPDADTLSRNIVSRMPGQALPASFLATNWPQKELWLLPACLKVTASQCDAYLADLTGTGKPNVLLIPVRSAFGTVFGQNPAGEWQVLGEFNIAPDCGSVRDALSSGNYHLTVPSLRNLEIGGQRIPVTETDRQPGICKP
ncbi:DUF4153 domain-containing protein [Paraburkholderia sp.]|uniref:DUF4153 domain-containing protein n=1 Tax=Paraburkholderia sp. TaxID=1926495 RepID=UPI003D6FEAFF